MGQLEDLKTMVEKADVDILVSSYYQKLCRDHGMQLSTFNDVYLAIPRPDRNRFSIKIMQLAKEFKRLGWYCVLASPTTMIISRSQPLAKQRAAEYAQGEREEEFTRLRVESQNLSHLEKLEGYVEMANTKLNSDTLEGQIKELRTLKYQVNSTKDGGYTFRMNDDRLAITPGDALAVRARMEAYAAQMWPGNTFTHFVIKSGPKGMYFMMGISSKNMSEAISLV